MTDEVRGCEDGEVRLDGGFASSTGRVEVCMDRRWGGVCSDGFDMKDARVVCSGLDFNPGGKLNVRETKMSIGHDLIVLQCDSGVALDSTNYLGCLSLKTSYVCTPY